MCLMGATSSTKAGTAPQRHGYRVLSAVGSEEAKELCSTKADLLLLGDSVPRVEKQHTLDCFRRYNDAETLSLLAPGQTELAGANYAIGRCFYFQRAKPTTHGGAY